MVDTPYGKDEKSNSDQAKRRIHIDGDLTFIHQHEGDQNGEKGHEPESSSAHPSVKQKIWGVLASASFWTALATVVIAGFTIALYQVSMHQWQTTEKQLELGERPWISEEISLAGPLTFDEKGGSVLVTIALKGLGNSVAVNVHPFCKLGALKYQNRGIEAFEKASCDSLGGQTETNPSAGNMLFPSEPLVEVNGVNVSQKDIAEAIRYNSAVMKSDMGGMFDPLLVCCVDYRFAFDRRHHQTRRAYTMAIPEGAGMWLGIRPTGTANGAILLPSFEGNSAN